MARIWKQPYKEVAGDRLNLFVPMGEAKRPIESVYFVYVCSFQFTFTSVGQISEYLTWYSHPWKPSRRSQEPTAADHWERQSPFDELPLYLYEEPKRRKVVNALTRAVRQFSTDAKRGK